MKLICFLFYSFVFLFFPSVFPRLAAGHNVALATLAILDGILAGYFRIDQLRFSVGLACVLINLPVTRDHASLPPWYHRCQRCGSIWHCVPLPQIHVHKWNFANRGCLRVSSTLQKSLVGRWYNRVCGR